MYNRVLERQANDAKNEVKSVIEDLITEIHELEDAHQKLEDTIELYAEIIEELKARINELENSAKE
jgi:DNA repair exonuclease SbcCD ATPase subunit